MNVKPDIQHKSPGSHGPVPNRTYLTSARTIFRSLNSIPFHLIPFHSQGWLWAHTPGRWEQQPCPCIAALNCSSPLLPRDIDNVIWRPGCSLATHGLKLFLQISPAIRVQLSQDQVALFTAWVGICVLPAFK